MRKIYYHYTSMAALFSIIENKEIWLSNLLNSNDPNENYLSCQEFNSYYKKAGLDPFNGDPYILPQNEIIGDTFGISFSSLKDNLSQWERYGDGLTGVCLGIDVDFLRSKLWEKWLFDLEFEKIKYSEKEKLKYILRKVKNIKYPETKCPFAQFTIEGLYYTLYYSICRSTFKKSEYSVEKEYRLYYDPVNYTFTHNMIQAMGSPDSEVRLRDQKGFAFVEEKLHLLEKDKKYMLSKRSINSYLPLNLLDLGDDYGTIIKEIIIGPKSMQNEKELLSFCKSFGFNPIISRSTISIR